MNEEFLNGMQFSVYYHMLKSCTHFLKSSNRELYVARLRKRAQKCHFKSFFLNIPGVPHKSIGV